MSTTLPRMVIAAPGSGHGKTTVASGLMGALRAEGLDVAGFKIGPDYIDPGYHTLATGRPGRNLDPYLCGAERMVPLLLHGAAVPTPADVAVVEGVMGLFDGQIGGEGFASTAHVAGLISAPVVLVIDISQLSRTAAAVVHGLTTFEPGLRIAGVILNQAGSDRHVREVRSALDATGVEVLGVLPRSAEVVVPSRHLGLVPAAERDDAEATMIRLAGQVAEHVDLSRVLAAAHAAPPLDGKPWRPDQQVGAPSDRRPVVAIAGGRAFTFRYPETEELIRAAGCEPVIFDPLKVDRLPDGTAGLYLGGGFPEMHAADLAANEALRTAIAAAVGAGLPTVAECAGLLYLCHTVDGQPMTDALDATAVMTPKLVLGYRQAVADHDHLISAAGVRVTGHEFHRTAVTAHDQDPAWLLDGIPDGVSADPAGLGRPTLHASYLHVHWAGHPHLAQRFCDAVHAYAIDHDHDLDDPLDHHGDAEVTGELVDLAVNVRLPEPPAWLATVINDTTSRLAAYPRPRAAAQAIADAHGRSVGEVLPTAGGAEAFTLLARSRAWRRPVIVHPQFTEPEAALRAAGLRPTRIVLDRRDGFRLDPDRVPEDADLVVLGNPTNPTGVLHSAETITALARPGRVLCVDEAFLDAVPGERETMITSAAPGVLVVRSLTKTWGLAGLRAGYVVGDKAVMSELRRQQPPWSVSAPACAVIEACLTPEARALAAIAAGEIAQHRVVLLAGLEAVGLRAAGDPVTPFVLVDTAGWPAEIRRPLGWVRSALREQGFAVRRGDTFPGLGADWIRIAVRDPQTSEALVKALRVIAESPPDSRRQ